MAAGRTSLRLRKAPRRYWSAPQLWEDIFSVLLNQRMESDAGELQSLLARVDAHLAPASAASRRLLVELPRLVRTCRGSAACSYVPRGGR